MSDNLWTTSQLYDLKVIQKIGLQYVDILELFQPNGNV